MFKRKTRNRNLLRVNGVAIYLVGFSVGVSYRPVQITMKAVAEAEIV